METSEKGPYILEGASQFFPPGCLNEERVEELKRKANEKVHVVQKRISDLVDSETNQNSKIDHPDEIPDFNRALAMTRRWSQMTTM